MTDETTPPLTLQRMREDIARLLRMPPGEIGEEDDLGDLGLDSMRAMAVLQRWSEAGLALDFTEMAERPTLATWWAIAQRQMARPAHG